VVRTHVVARWLLVSRPRVGVHAFFSQSRELDVITPDLLRFLCPGSVG